MFKFQVSVQNQYIILHKYKFLISIKKRCTACFIYMTSANSGEPTKMERTAVITNHRLSLGLLWLVMAVSSIVFIEPTPYDTLGVALMLVFFGLGMRIPAGLGSATYLLGVFALANIVASALAPDPVASLRSLTVRLYMLASWVFFTCVIYEDPKRLLRLLFSGYTVAAIIAVTLGILGYYKLVPYTEQLLEFGRVRALFKDPNVYGPFLIPVALYLVARLESATLIQKLFLIGIFAFLTFGILLGFSRGSWLNFAVSLLLYFILRLLTQTSARLKRQLLLQAGAVAMFSVLFVGWAINTNAIQSMVERRSKVQYYDVAEQGGRFSRQLAVIDRALVTPIGIGAGQSGQKYYFSSEPHNIYLQLLIESGWIGALAFFAFLALTLRQSFHFIFQPSTIQAVYIAGFACFIGILVQSLFIDSTHWRHMYFLLAVLWGPLLAWRTDTRSHDWVNEIGTSTSSKY